MPLQLGDDGLLPEGLHKASADDVWAMLVAGRPDKERRAHLYHQWLAHRRALSGLVRIVTQWLDGGFVGRSLEPGDIDVLTIVAGQSYDELDNEEERAVLALTAGHDTRAVWEVESIMVVERPEGHASYRAYRHLCSDWLDTWSRVRGDPGRRKGLVEVQP